MPVRDLAERLPLVDDLHGHRVPDPYRWLEDGASTQTRSWLDGEDGRWRTHAATLPARRRLHQDVRRLSATGVVTAPRWRGDRQFFLRQEPGQEHPVLYVSESDGAPRVLLDPMALDSDGLVVLDAWHPSHDGARLAFQISRGGTENSVLHVLDVESGEPLDGPVRGCRSTPVAWLPGARDFCYVREQRVWLHRVGTPVGQDVAVTGRTGSFGLEIDEGGRWLILSEGTGLWLVDLGTGALRTVHEGPDGRAAAMMHKDLLYIVTDQDAPRGRVCVADPSAPSQWRELIPEDPAAVISGLAVLDGMLVVSRIRHAIGEVSLHDLGTGDRVAEVPVPGAGSLGSVSTRGREAWFSYTDSVTPGAVHRYDAETHQTTLWAGPPGIAVPEVTSRQVTATSPDGTPIRVVVLAKPGSGPRPTILYGYGGFGIPLTPSYSSYILAWVEAGGVFASAQVRGGGEEGEQWHRDGMLDRKQNVFDDFVAVAEHLIAEGWTTPAQLGICGESNGGLLVAGALTQRPELFAAAVCSAPLLDMVRYEQFGLGPQWREEYGTAEDPEHLAWLLGYSPYHRVREGVAYPAVLFTTFGGDTRVDPMHARKMCAALQWATTSGRPVLLRHEPDVGHGASSATRAIQLAGDMLAFLAAHTGLDIP
ncbi:prolyl oligopeptidase [Amycolatopsis sulphurea]|uniref:prolyl oligopeptidase n=1 Tax=Amycolatopsis sulphurea TaxID=76022 RepID=A0A2A9G2U0_9PSEU|nr:prolyl oligopeptidase family serine peptidase [Amycolatopsis sulphurea]PFG57172.1 prolyl oligopeptidase [Amycolatopsis sulphurea]